MHGQDMRTIIAWKITVGANNKNLYGCTVVLNTHVFYAKILCYQPGGGP